LKHNQEESMSEARPKPFNISRQTVWEAYLRVKANGGSAGVDEQSIEGFEENLKDNLYKIWNRMSSGTWGWKDAKTRHTYGSGSHCSDGI
jgi:retron-type reverse transcriptase